MKKAKETWVALAVGLILLLLGSVLAHGFNTSFHTVDVTRIAFSTERGRLSGILYLPDGTDAEHPRPAVVTTHGYLNSAEMQDAQAIELSRRGYVVLALDMYDHGHSAGNAGNTGSFASFWPTSIWDAVNYIYEQDYVLKDADGNGMIAVSGHSMGGFSAEMALYYDEQAYLASGVRKICAGLSVGADYSYTQLFGVDAQIAADSFGGRTIGKIAAHYDEFFFNSDPAATDTVVYKDYVSTEEASILLEQAAPQANTWYIASDGGQRIIYEPGETHPWNHFSKTSTAYALSFYERAFFSCKESGIVQIDSQSQAWMFKELFECVALIGFLLMLLSLAALLIRLPLLKNSVCETSSSEPSLPGGGKAGDVVLFLISMLIPALLYPSLNTADPSAGMTVLRVILALASLAAICAVLCVVLPPIRKRGSWKKLLPEGLIFLLCSVLLTVMYGIGIATITPTTADTASEAAAPAFFQADGVSLIMHWAVVCACISAMLLLARYVFGKQKDPSLSPEVLGFCGGWKVDIRSCLQEN